MEIKTKDDLFKVIADLKTTVEGYEERFTNLENTEPPNPEPEPEPSSEPDDNPEPTPEEIDEIDKLLNED